MIKLLYLVTNISDNNITHGDDTIKPTETRHMLNVDDLKIMFKMGHMSCEIIGEEKVVVEKTLIEEKSEKSEEKFINKNQNIELTESLFKFYLNEKMFKRDIEALKKMYKNLIIFHQIDNSILELLNDVNNREELVEILLNHIYPAMLNDATKES